MASFNAQEIEFLQNHGNDICHDTWLALWDLPSAAEPESRDEQKVKDFLAKKYERKLWYSTRPKVKIPKQEPEAKPLKTLLGENAPQVIVSNQLEQKSPRISPPHANTTTVLAKPVQPVATHNEVKSNMDLLGDLGSDPFGSNISQQNQNQNAFGMFQQPPPPQNQPQSSAAVFPSSSFESFANSSSIQPPMDPFQTTPMNPQSSNDLFAISSVGSSQSSFPSGNTSGNDKYAALADLDLFKTSATQSVFSGTSMFGTSPNTRNTGMQMNAQPNPFMSPGTGSSGAAVFQQQQQKAANPFQTSSAGFNTTAFGGQNVSSQQSFGGFDTNSSNQLANNWSNLGQQNQQINNWPRPSGGGYANGGVNFNMSSSGQQGTGLMNNNIASVAGGQQHAFGGTQYQSQSNNASPFMPHNTFNQNNFQPTQQQSAAGFASHQQPMSTSFSHQPHNFDLFGQQQQQQQQQTFATNFNSQFGMQQQNANNNSFPNQVVGRGGGGTKPPFGGVQMPGFGHQQSQPQQPFGNWQQQQQSTHQRSNNPFM